MFSLAQVKLTTRTKCLQMNKKTNLNLHARAWQSNGEQAYWYCLRADGSVQFNLAFTEKKEKTWRKVCFQHTCSVKVKWKRKKTVGKNSSRLSRTSHKFSNNSKLASHLLYEKCLIFWSWLFEVHSQGQSCQLHCYKILTHHKEKTSHWISHVKEQLPTRGWTTSWEIKWERRGKNKWKTDSEKTMGEQVNGEKESEKERKRGETASGRHRELGQVTWLGLTTGRIKYPTACGHLHNKCRFHFINYFSSMGEWGSA